MHTAAKATRPVLFAKQSPRTNWPRNPRQRLRRPGVRDTTQTPPPGWNLHGSLLDEESPSSTRLLSEVKDRKIRKSLARRKGRGRTFKTVRRHIQSGLDSDFNKWRFSDSQMDDVEKKELPAPPKSLTDFAAIAQKNGLKEGKNGPEDNPRAGKTPVGKSSVSRRIDRTFRCRYYSRGHDLELYQPVKTVDIDGNRFIAMKISDTPGKVPTLAEVKDEVVKAWRKQQAEELAKKYAEEFAKKAEEAKTPLAAFFADNKSIKVVRTDPFSELTGGEVSFVGGQNQQQPYRLSQPGDIVAPGPDFLRGVFNLKDGQVAVLTNNDHSIAYVVRIVEHQPNLAGLRTAYMADAFHPVLERPMNQLHSQGPRPRCSSNWTATSRPATASRGTATTISLKTIKPTKAE